MLHAMMRKICLKKIIIIIIILLFLIEVGKFKQNKQKNQ